MHDNTETNRFFSVKTVLVAQNASQRTHKETNQRNITQNKYNHMSIEQRKSEIRQRLAQKMEHPRVKEIREKNAKVALNGTVSKIKLRHERRHGGIKGTSLSERKESMKDMSKDIGRSHRNHSTL